MDISQSGKSFLTFFKKLALKAQHIKHLDIKLFDISVDSGMYSRAGACKCSLKFVCVFAEQSRASALLNTLGVQ